MYIRRGFYGRSALKKVERFTYKEYQNWLEGANLKDAVPVAIFPGLVVSVVFDPPHGNAW